MSTAIAPGSEVWYHRWFAPMRLKLSRTILKWIACAGFLALIASIGFIEHTTYSNGLEDLQKEQSVITQGQAIVIATLLTSGNEDQILLALSGTLADPDIVGASLTIFEHNTEQSFGTTDSQETTLLSYEKTITALVDDEIVELGVLTTFASDRRLVDTMMDRFPKLAMMVGLVLFAIILAALMIVYRVVGRPIALLADVISHGRQGNIVQINDVPNNEIGLAIRELHDLQQLKQQQISGLRIELSDHQDQEAERTRCLVNATLEGIIIELDGEIVDANKAITSLLECDRDTLLGSSIDRWLPYWKHQPTQRLQSPDQGEAASSNNLPSAIIQCEISVGHCTSKIVEMHTRPFNYLGQMAHVIAVRDVTERAHAEDRIRYLAMHDELTGIANRRAFREALDRLVKMAPISDFYLLAIDLDRFKPVNDTLGHSAGDELLIAFSQRIAASLHRKDFFARLGGDEFAIIVDNSDNHHVDIENLARRLIDTTTSPFRLKAGQCRIGVSIGVAHSSTCLGGQGCQGDAERLMRLADNALYEAKHAGRGRYAISAQGHPNTVPEPSEV